MISVIELLDMHDTKFVEKTYEVIFNRQPDPGGLTYYVGRLRTGYSKISVLDQFSKSPEAGMAQVTVSGLREKLNEYRSARRSIWGLWARRYHPVFGMAPRLRSARALENAVGRGREDMLTACQRLSAESEILRGLIYTLMEQRSITTDAVVSQPDQTNALRARTIADVREFDLPVIGRNILSALSV